MRELFLDANAHLPMNPKALKAYCDFNASSAGHGHAMSPSKPGRAAQLVIEESRDKIAGLIGAKSSQIIFTSTCTQACEWGIYLLAKTQQYNDDGIYYSMAEHPSVRQALDEHFGSRTLLEIDKNGIINLTYPFERAKAGRIIPKGIFVAIYVQNEIGIIQPIELLDSYNTTLFSDFSQAPGKIRFNLSDMKVDIAPFAAHKFGGPPGVGFLYIKNEDMWREFGTGSRYFLDRPGTPDTGAILATAVALQDTIDNFDKINENMLSFRDTLEDGLNELGVVVIGKDSNRVNNTTFIRCGDGMGMKIMLELGEQGIYTGLGSACGSAYSGSNPYLSSMGIDGGPHDFMRISTFGEYTSKDASYFLSKFRKYFLKGGD